MAWKYVAVLDLYKNNGIKVCIVTEISVCVFWGMWISCAKSKMHSNACKITFPPSLTGTSWRHVINICIAEHSNPGELVRA